MNLGIERFFELLVFLIVFPSCCFAARNQSTETSITIPSCADSGETVCTGDLNCHERLNINNSSTMEVFRNYSLFQVHCSVTHAVIVIHGRDLNPRDYFNYTVEAASSSGHLSNTLIISPYFREQLSTKLDSDLYWNRDKGSASVYDWAMGGQSFAPIAVSSYVVFTYFLPL